MTPVPRPLAEAELLDWLRLIRSENVGPRTFQVLLARFGSARAAIDAVPALARRGGPRAITLAALRDVEGEFQALRRAGMALLPLCDPAFPPSLRVIDTPPPLLAVKGSVTALQRPMVAMVGARNASAVGLIMTERLAQGIGQAGFLVVSGLARGIDAKAHRTSLETGTVAVLAGGHDKIYPADHARLVDEIVAAGGAVLSEMPLGWEPRARDFPRRNRIVSGLSLGVVVVEAARRSGSLITARFAAEQGREVFAVPGSPIDPRAEGANDLIAQGATLCRRADDVVDALAPMRGHVPAPTLREGEAEPGYWDEADLEPGDGIAPRQRALDPAPQPVTEPESQKRPPREALLDLIGAAPVGIDDLVRLAGLPTGVVMGLLVELELDGRIDRHGLQAVSRVAG